MLIQAMNRGKSPMAQEVRQVILMHVVANLFETRGNRVQTAKNLDISIRTLRNWIREQPELAEWKIEWPPRCGRQ